MKKNNLKKIILITTVLILLVCLPICKKSFYNDFLNFVGVKTVKSDFRKNAGLAVTMVDVGHGDSILITSKDDKGQNCSALIDTGSAKYSQNVINVLHNKNVKTLDFIMISHLHSDHMGGLFDILKDVKVKEIILPNYFKVKSSLLRYSKLRNFIKSKNINIVNVKPNQKIPIGKSVFKVLYPIIEQKSKLPKDLNDSSIVGILQYNKFKMMFTGDATFKVEQKILNNYSADELKCDVLKLGHHGSKTSSSLNFLKAVAPTYALISSGQDRDCIYPHKEVKQRLHDLNIISHNTVTDGNIYISVNKDEYEISNKR